MENEKWRWLGKGMRKWLVMMMKWLTDGKMMMNNDVEMMGKMMGCSDEKWCKNWYGGWYDGW